MHHLKGRWPRVRPQLRHLPGLPPQNPTCHQGFVSVSVIDAGCNLDDTVALASAADHYDLVTCRLYNISICTCDAHAVCLSTCSREKHNKTTAISAGHTCMASKPCVHLQESNTADNSTTYLHGFVPLWCCLSPSSGSQHHTNTTTIDSATAWLWKHLLCCQDCQGTQETPEPMQQHHSQS